MASSSSSSCSKPPQDQVFINFRGDELRCNFVSHLYDALKVKEINVFMDNDQEKGENINGLLEEIKKSRIALAIFSSRYTEAKWCLKELAKMRERVEEGELVVIPIFYKVDPNTVEEQRGEFGDKFRDLVKKGNKEEKKEWKKALKYFAKLQGRVLHEKSVESRFITDIVEDVLKKLKNPSRASSSSNPPSGTYLSGTGQDKVESLCGIEIRLKQLGEKISFGSGETTRIIGVVGPPGIGKSTLVKKFYEDSKERLSRHVFIPDVQQIRKEDNDLRYLLKILLEDLLGVKNPKIETVKRAHEASKNQLLQKKAFVVLDNVGDREEIDAILGQRDWIKQGSKIVIATSDKSLLIHAGVKNIYEVPPLSYQHSLQHFAHHAFGGQSYDSSFSKLLNEFMHYTKGNPLALKVLGGGLLGKDVSLWSEKMDALKQCHNGQERRSEKMPAQSSIQMLLSVWKGSYDALTQEQKDTLLDISYFRSLDENYVASLLDSYGETSTKIAELVNKFLISISGGKIHMHDTLHMFCEQIGQEASATDGKGRRRLWEHDKIIDVLDTNKGASGIRSIFLDLADFKTKSFDNIAFASMTNMQYLKIYSTRCPQECNPNTILNFPDGLHLPLDELRCLHWLKFPLKELPQDFDPKNLVDLKLPYSKIEKVWESDKGMIIGRFLGWGS